MTICGGTLFASTYANIPDDTIELELEEFAVLLRMYSEQPIPAKAVDQLFSPSHYDPALAPDTKRGLANITKSFGIWLDNDGGGMPWEQFVALFPDWRIVVSNSYNSPTKSPPKYHTFIPADHTMTPELYGAIAKHIIAQVKAVCPEHSFDLTKLNAAALFYLPCRDRDGGGFFHDLNEPPRRPLDVMTVGREAALAAVDREPIYIRTVPRILTDKARHLRIERALTKWRNASHADGEDHLGFFLLGVRLMRGAECDDAETARILAEEAHLSHNPSKRKKQIPDIIKQVRSKHS